MPRQDDDPERRCIVTRTALPADELIRFVADPEGRIVADLKRDLPGRGAWVTARASLVAEAERKKLFGRALKAEVTVEPGLAERVGERLAAAALGTIAMARKAGLLVTGFAKVEAAIGSGAAKALIHASDAALDGVRKLDQAVRRKGPAYQPVAVTVFDSHQLNLALGGTNVIHAALLAGRLSEEALKRIAGLVRYRDSGGSQAAGLAPGLSETRLPLGQKAE